MISTRVTDAGRGIPAYRVPVQLDAFITGQGWKEVGHGMTSTDGTVYDFGAPEVAGIYRLMFDIAAYSSENFFPSITVMFEVKDPAERHHVPLILSAFGYSTYRES